MVCIEQVECGVVMEKRPEFIVSECPIMLDDVVVVLVLLLTRPEPPARPMLFLEHLHLLQVHFLKVVSVLNLAVFKLVEVLGNVNHFETCFNFLF